MEAQADAGDRDREIGELPAVERQALNLRDIDDAPDLRGRGVHQRGIAADDDRLSHARDDQRNVDRYRLPDVDHQGLALELVEARKFGGDVIGSDGQRQEAIDAFRVRHLGADETRRVVLTSNRNARDSGPLSVGDAPGDAACGLLRVGRGGERNQQRKGSQGDPLH